MKRSFLFSFITLVLTSTLFAQADCNAFFLFKEGVTMEFSTYNKKDKLQATGLHSIKKVESTADGGVEAEVQTAMTDKKGKEMHEGTYTVKCKDATLYLDMSRMFPAEMMESMGQAEIEMEGSGLTLPSNLEVGETLPDATTTIKLSSSGLGNLMNMEVAVTNRKVTGKEEVTTPAGTFDCYKITYDTSIKSIMNRTTPSAEWYAENVGVVKTENYKKNGKLDSYTILTKLDK